MTASYPSFPGISFPVVRSIALPSIRQESLTSGRRTILPQRATPRRSWNIPYEFLRNALWSDGNGALGSYSELETLEGFWLAQVAAGVAFSYTDPNDNAVTAQGFGVGDGSTRAFQLVRARGAFVEPVYLGTPVASPNGIFINGTGTSAFTQSATGVITFTSAPAAAAVLTWTGTFAWLCRFDDDSIDLSGFMQGMSSVAAVKFSAEINP